MCFISVFLAWPLRRWIVAVATAAVTFLGLGLSSAVIANPVFDRSVSPTPWSMDVLVLTSVLAGALTATYVRSPAVPTEENELPARGGMIGSALAYLAIGWPACNTLMLRAVGSTGAIELFARIQPFLAAIGLAVLAYALYVRLRGEATCAWKPPLDAIADGDPRSDSHPELVERKGS